MFFFKGNRDYLHSTDVYSFLIKNFKFNSIDIKFSKFIKSQPSLRVSHKLFAKENRDKVLPSITASITNKNKSKLIMFYPTKQKIKYSYSYDENLLISYFKVSKNTVSCNFNTSIKHIDLVVSMSKYWHQKKINSKKKWIVIRLTLKQKIKFFLKKKIKIENIKILDGKFTTSEIFVNNVFVGKIYYSYID